MPTAHLAGKHELRFQQLVDILLRLTVSQTKKQRRLPIAQPHQAVLRQRPRPWEQGKAIPKKVNGVDKREAAG